MLLITYNANNLGNVLIFIVKLFLKIVLDFVFFKRGCAFAYAKYPK